MAGPNFFVIGAARSGTTALHHFLGAHPQVFMCPAKEPNFFAFDGELGDLRGPGTAQLAGHSVVDRAAYLKLFNGVRGETAVGEVSPRYLVADGCAERIHREYPDARLVAVLRQPVERAWASFTGHRKDGWERSPDFRAAFEAEPARIAAGQSMGLHFSAGRYAGKLRPYYRLFGPERLHVALYDDLRDDPAATLAAMFEFLGVDPGFPVDTSPRHNPSGEIRNPVVRVAWQRSEGLRRALRRWIPETLRDRAYAALTSKLERRELPPDLKAEFTAWYRDDIEELSGLIGRDLGCWLE